MQFAFHPGPRLIAGPGTSVGLADHLPAGPLLFVTDAALIRMGLAAIALDALRSAGRAVTVFDAVEPDPSAATVLAATAAGAEAGAVAVVGFGGGSPMDVAKLAAYLLGSGNRLDDIYGVDRAAGRRLPLVLVPTTAGTGSEATPVAIVTVGGGQKQGVVAWPLLPDMAILDAALTTGLPRAVTAATGIDAMVHAIEAFTSRRRHNPMSDLLAIEALRLLDAHLPAACDRPADLDARGAMLLGAHLAGVAFANAPVGGVHALAYPLGGRFHVPHGVSNALMLAPVLRHNMASAASRYALLAQAIGMACDAEVLLERLMQQLRATGLPLRLRDHAVPHDALPMLAADAMQQQRLLVNNPVPIVEADALRLYAEAW